MQDTNVSNTFSLDIGQNREILALDFDHTLFLSNSTEEYIDSVKPRFLCSLLLTVIDWLKIWNFFPGPNKRHVYRDAIRVFFVTLFFPWTYILYILRSRYLVKQYLNSDIIDLITSRQWKKIIIVSNGFRFILMPLIKLVGFNFDEVLSSRLLPSKDGIRSTGKGNKLKERLSTQELASTVLVSDNDEDLPLSNIVGELIHKKWPYEKRFKACQDLYVPFVYTHASKRGNKNHVLNVILLENFSILLLAYWLFIPFNLHSIASLFLLVCSFWCIYEVGYYENDLHELRYESVHKNIEKLNYVEKLKDFSFELYAWIWAIGFGTIGILLLQEDLCLEMSCLGPVFRNVLSWTLWLSVVRLIYRIYNYSTYSVRQLVFPMLQITRLAGPAIFFPINFLGLSIITSQIVSRWVGYLVYRGGGDPKLVQKRLVRHTVFLILVSGQAIIEKDFNIFLSWQFATILTWSIVRGHISSFSNIRTFMKPST